MVNRAFLRGLVFAPVFLAAQFAYAQQPPDAGQVLQDLQPPLAPPSADRGLDIERPVIATVPPGGPAVTVVALDIEGNTVFTDAELQAVLGDITGTYDLAGLHALADQISMHYRKAGYLFAMGYLPPQRIDDGRVRINVVEGRYGEVRAVSDAPELVMATQDYLYALRPGELISSRPLERAALLLGDLPGINVTPVVSPGTEPGAGDLLVQVERGQRVSGDISLDNHGNRYSGEHRLGGGLAVASPFRLGDELKLSGLVSEEDLRVGSIDYSFPIGAAGLRGRIAYAHTRYELGKNFAALGATGQAKVTSAGLSYPLLRTVGANLTVDALYQYKELRDEYRSLEVRDEKRSHTLPLTVRFDRRDHLAGGGVTYGSLTWTSGRLELGESLRLTDRATTQTHGEFNKLNLDIVRLQRLADAFTLYASFSTQWAADNLDSSESFGLGGAQGVRGYPSGEAFGDEGWLGQVELRYTLNAFSPYTFYDQGKIEVNARPGPEVEQHSERRSSAGFGLRWQYDGWHLDTKLAWRTAGGKPESDTRDRRPRTWLNLKYNF